MAHARPLFSVIIPTYNRRDTLLEALGRLAAQTAGPDAVEVVVVDDGSSDGTGAAIAARSWPFPLTYRRQRNRGPAAARNVGLGVARGELTLFVNDDTLLAADALEHHLARHRELRGERIMVLGSFDFVPHFAATPLGWVLGSTTSLFQFTLLRPGCRADHNFAYTCNLSLPTRAARAAGFDEAFTGPAGEDIDFGTRLGAQGYDVLYEPRAASHHDHVLTLRGLCRSQRTRGLGYTTYALKHGTTPRQLAVMRSLAERVAAVEQELPAYVERVEAVLEAAPTPFTGTLPDRFYADFDELMVRNVSLGALSHPQAAALMR